MTDNPPQKPAARAAERERLQAEALKANLRRRKAQARGQKAVEQAVEQAASDAPPPPESQP